MSAGKYPVPYPVSSLKGSQTEGDVNDHCLPHPEELQAERMILS